MAKLTEDAKLHLGLIHSHDVFKVLAQLRIVCNDIDQIEEFTNFSKQEAEELVRLTEKYHKQLCEIKTM